MRIAPQLREYQPQIGYTGPIMSKRDDTEDDRHSPEFEPRVRTAMQAKTIVIAERQLEEVAMRAAKAGVREGIIEMWRQLGIDINDADGVRLFTKDLINLRDYSESLERRKDAVKSTLTDLLVSSIKWTTAVAALYVIHLIYLDIHK